MPSLVVTLLAERSPAELESIREKTQADLNRLKVELEQVEAAQALQARAEKPQRSRGGRPSSSKAGSTRQRVLKVVGTSPTPISPAQIRQALAEQGGFQPAGGSLYSMIKRLTAEGALRKIADGQYMLPARNGSDAEPTSGPNENGTGQPLSMAVPTQDST